MMRSGKTPSRGRTHYYIGQSERSARPFVRQRPECAAFVDARQLVGRHSSRRSAKSVRPSGKSMRKTPTFSRKSPAFLSPPRRRARPHGRGTGEKFHIAAEKVRRNAHAFTFFLFLLAFYEVKTRYICIENLFYQLRMAKSRRFVPVIVCPAECSPPFLPSL